MKRERQVLFNVDEDLYEEYKELCEQAGTNASRKLREFVIAYVKSCRDNNIKQMLQEREV